MRCRRIHRPKAHWVSASAAARRVPANAETADRARPAAAANYGMGWARAGARPAAAQGAGARDQLPRPGGGIGQPGEIRLIGKLERFGVDAEPQSARSRTVIEDMTEMGIAARAKDFSPRHPIGVVFLVAYVFRRDRLEKTRPTGAGMEFSPRSKERQTAADTAVHPLALVVEQGSAEGSFRVLPACNPELCRGKLRLPFRVRLDDPRTFYRADQLSTPIDHSDLHCVLLGNGNWHRNARPGAAAAIAKVTDDHPEDVTLGLRHTKREARPTQEHHSRSGARRELRRRSIAPVWLLTIGNEAPARPQPRMTGDVMVAKIPDDAALQRIAGHR